MRNSWIGLALAALWIAGCREYNCYELELRPEGDSLQRKLTCWRVAAQTDSDRSEKTATFPPDELTAIASAYSERLSPEGASRHQFRTTFSGPTPQDLGGAGSFHRLTSPVGSTSVYVERFRGNDDLDAQIYDKRQAADRLADLIVGWCDAEAGKSPESSSLRQFLHQDFRQDLRNLALYYWLSKASASRQPQDQRDRDLGVRLSQYLVERGYVSPVASPVWTGPILLDDPRRTLKLARELLARKLKLSSEAAIAKTFPFLADPDQLAESWNKYLASTPEYKQLLKRWERKKQMQPDASKPDPSEVIEEILGQSMLDLALFERPDEMQLTLTLPREPFATNGEWNRLLTQVVWSQPLPKGSSLPVLCYAAWSEPDADYQRLHFGIVAIDGEELAHYVGWYRTLSAQQQMEWDGMLEDLMPKDDPGEKLARFVFTGEPAQQPQDAAQPGKQLLLKGLKRAGQEE